MVSWDITSQTGIYTIGFPVLGSLDMFSGSPAYKEQIMGLLSFHNHMNQFFIINVCVCVCVCVIGSVSLENTE